MKWRTMGVATLVWTSLAGAGCHDPHPSEAEELNGQGLLLLDKGKHIDALGLFKEALTKNRENPQTLYYIGYTYLLQARRKLDEKDPVAAESCVDDALYYLDAALRSAPGHETARDARAEALMLKDQLSGEAPPPPEAYEATSFGKSASRPTTRGK